MRKECKKAQPMGQKHTELHQLPTEPEGMKSEQMLIRPSRKKREELIRRMFWESPIAIEICDSEGEYLGRVHTKQRIGDQSEIDEEHEYYVELIESREDSTIVLQPPKKPFHLISLLVHLSIVFPWRNPVRLRWHHWSHAKIQDQLTSFFALICPLHNNEVGLQVRGL